MLGGVCKRSVRSLMSTSKVVRGFASPTGDGNNPPDKDGKKPDHTNKSKEKPVKKFLFMDAQKLVTPKDASTEKNIGDNKQPPKGNKQQNPQNMTNQKNQQHISEQKNLQGNQKRDAERQNRHQRDSSSNAQEPTSTQANQNRSHNTHHHKNQQNAFNNRKAESQQANTQHQENQQRGPQQQRYNQNKDSEGQGQRGQQASNQPLWSSSLSGPKLIKGKDNTQQAKYTPFESDEISNKGGNKKTVKQFEKLQQQSNTDEERLQLSGDENERLMDENKESEYTVEDMKKDSIRDAAFENRKFIVSIAGSKNM